MKTKESQCNVNIEKVLFCVCHMHAHDFSTPVHSLSFWYLNICKTGWRTEFPNIFFPCIARLWNSVPAYCFPLSYNLHLFNGDITMHLASLTITWKPTNKNMKSQSLQLYIFWHFTIILRLLSKHLCLLPFSPKGSVSLLFT